jgi:2-polyprenyl-3-methyl-5-hydroxy-6-metoxy-1,4-benzoquinol methylase
MIVDVATRLHGRVLDVGCGEGLLVERLAAVSLHVIGVDRDEVAVRRARERTASLANVTLVDDEFLAMTTDPGAFDLVTFVAVIHHMDLKTALRRAKLLLRPGGELVVVGLAANRTPDDYMISALTWPAIRILSRLHREARDVGVVAVAPSQSLRQIRAIALGELPGARMRRGLSSRYILRWRHRP